MAFWSKKKNQKSEDLKEKDLVVRLENFNGTNFSMPQKMSDMDYFRAEEELMRQKDAGQTLNNQTGEKKLSVAKTYGTKYASDGVQMASSKVVDVRSYVKEEPKFKTEPVRETFEEKKPESPTIPRRSFFDDLLKELEEDAGVQDKTEEPLEQKPVVQEVKKKPAVKKAAPKKKKKSIDIDIISGDFGGSSIL